MLIADSGLVERLLPMNEAIPAMREALAMLTAGGASMPLRTFIGLPHGAQFGLMPSQLDDLDAVGVKVTGIFPPRGDRECTSYRGAVLVFDTARGELTGVVDAVTVTAIRTAAVSGVATDLLARADAGDLALIGAGTQARAHLRAMASVRRLRRVRVFSVPTETAIEFAESESSASGFSIEVMDSAEEAVENADIICTVTTSPDPVVLDAWVMDGTHVNAVGAYTPATRELDSGLVVRARLYADRRDSLLAEAGEFIIPRDEGLIGDDHVVGEIGEVLAGTAPARGSTDEVTVFKSLGLAVEDLAGAQRVVMKARELGVGRWLDLSASSGRGATED
jgi:ornithine cyclodeaminase